MTILFRRFSPTRTLSSPSNNNERKGNCLVPIGYKDNVQLSNWVSTQRQEYKLRKDGRSSRLTAEKIKKLEDIGFVWEAQRGGPRRRKTSGPDSPPRPPIQPRSSTKYSVPVHRLKDRPSVNSSIRRKKQKQKQQLQQAHQCQQQAIGARSHMDKIDEMIVLQQNHSAGSSRMSPPAPAATVGTATNKPIVAAGDPAMRAGAATDPLAAAAAIHGHGMALSIPSNIGTSVPPAPSSAAAAASAAAHQAHLFQTERVPGAAPSPASLTPAAAASLYGSSPGRSVAYLQRLAG